MPTEPRNEPLGNIGKRVVVAVGMAPFFYSPHTLFVAERGLEHFDLSMRAQYELTKRFSAEGSIRPYIAKDPAGAANNLNDLGKVRRANGSQLGRSRKFESAGSKARVLFVDNQYRELLGSLRLPSH